MMLSVILSSFLEQLLLLIALTYVFSYLLPVLKRLQIWQQETFVGLIFGIFALISMINAKEVLPGVVVDLRGPIIVVACVLMGWRAGGITAALVLGYRLYLGGVGATISIPATITLWALGVWAYRQSHGHILPSRWLRLGLGLAAALQAYIWPLLFLPFENALNFFRNSAPVLVLIYPLATFALLDLLEREYKRNDLFLRLQESENRFKAIFNQSFQFLGILSPDGRVEETNDTSLAFIGMGRDEILQKPFWELDAWKSKPEMAEQIQAAIERGAKGESSRLTLEVLGKNQEGLMIDFSLKPVRDAEGKVTMLIPEGRDISPEVLAENRRLELALANEKMRVLQRFIEDASHNLRTPIAVLQTSLYISQRRNEELSSIYHNLEAACQRQDKVAYSIQLENLGKGIQQMQSYPPKMLRAAKDLHAAVEGMLSILSLDENTGIKAFEDDIIAVSRASLENYRALLAEKALEFTLDAPTEPLTLAFDAALWQKLLGNLLENAILYTPNGGKIHATLCQLGNELLFELADTGIGIPEQDLPQIYQRFFRAENAKAVKSLGTGLGLSIVKRIVELHHGRIEVTSKLNAGTVFRVYLPMKV